MNNKLTVDTPVIVDCQNFFLHEENSNASYLPFLKGKISQRMIATMLDGVKNMITTGGGEQ